MTAPLLRLETRVALGALRRAVTHPTRRTLWIAAGTTAAFGIVLDVATSDAGSRNFGTWSPPPAAVAGAALTVLALAALVGRRTPLTYGTRGADAVWWRYAGVDTNAGQRATTALLTLRAAAAMALGAVPLGALFALAAPQHAPAVALLALVTIVLAPAAVLVSSAFAPSITGDASPAAATARHASAARSFARETVRRPSRGNVPRGLLAARWLVAVRRRRALLPYSSLAAGAFGGLVVPRFAGMAGGDLVSMAIVVGGFALLLDGALRRTTAPTMLLSPWWRCAIGTSSRAVLVWALADAAEAAAFGIGAAIGVGVALGAPLLGLAAVPTVVLAPVALRLVVLAVDVLFPSAIDRRGAGAALRVATVASLAASVAALALAAGARGGAFAFLAASTVLLTDLSALSAWWCAAKIAKIPGN